MLSFQGITVLWEFCFQLECAHSRLLAWIMKQWRCECSLSPRCLSPCPPSPHFYRSIPRLTPPTSHTHFEHFEGSRMSSLFDDDIFRGRKAKAEYTRGLCVRGSVRDAWQQKDSNNTPLGISVWAYNTTLLVHADTHTHLCVMLKLLCNPSLHVCPFTASYIL